MPRYLDIDWRGLDMDESTSERIMGFDRERILMQTLTHEELFLKLHSHLPKEMIFERELLVSRLKISKKTILILSFN